MPTVNRGGEALRAKFDFNSAHHLGEGKTARFGSGWDRGRRMVVWGGNRRATGALGGRKGTGFVSPGQGPVSYGSVWPQPRPAPTVRTPCPDCLRVRTTLPDGRGRGERSPSPVTSRMTTSLNAGVVVTNVLAFHYRVNPAVLPSLQDSSCNEGCDLVVKEPI